MIPEMRSVHQTGNREDRNQQLRLHLNLTNPDKLTLFVLYCVCLSKYVSLHVYKKRCKKYEIYLCVILKGFRSCRLCLYRPCLFGPLSTDVSTSSSSSSSSGSSCGEDRGRPSTRPAASRASGYMLDFLQREREKKKNPVI